MNPFTRFIHRYAVTRCAVVFVVWSVLAAADRFQRAHNGLNLRDLRDGLDDARTGGRS